MEKDAIRLKNCKIKEIPYFTLSTPEPMLALCCDVYDGDTITVAMIIHDKIQKFKARLLGIDTPEIRTKNALEKEHGLKARDYVRKKILRKLVTLEIYDEDKYGRSLVNVYEMDQQTLKVDDLSINEKLILEEYAFSYNGGTKRKWGDYLEKQYIELLDSD